MQKEVLVVDDDVGFANGIAALLRAHGYAPTLPTMAVKPSSNSLCILSMSWFRTS